MRNAEALMQGLIRRAWAGVGSLEALMLVVGSQSIAAQEFSGREKLRAQTLEFRRDVIRVTDGVYVAVGYSVANSILIPRHGGSIVVDTTSNGADPRCARAELPTLSAAH